MRKKFLLIVGILVFVSANSQADTTSGSCGAKAGDCNWSIDENGHLTITGSGAMISSPWNKASVTSADIQGVTSISHGAFLSASNLKSVNIDSTVKTISNNAFLWTGLTEIIVPNSVTSVGADGVGGIKKVYCPSGTDCHATSGETVLYEKLEDGTYKVNGEVYSSLDDIPLDGDKFYECGSSLKACSAFFDAETGKLTITGSGAMTSSPWNKASVTSADIQGVTSISHGAFLSASNLKSVNIDSTVKTISNNAFLWTGLTEIIVPNSVTSVGADGVGGIKKVYCPSGTDCQSPNSIPYDKIGDYYSVGGKMYSSLKNMLKGIEMKRIYTVQEATAAVSKKGKNTFSIRYR